VNELESRPKEDNNKQKFNIYVTYDKNGKRFQDIVEDILIRKFNEI